MHMVTKTYQLRDVEKLTEFYKSIDWEPLFDFVRRYYGIGVETLQLCHGPHFNALKIDSLWNKAFELMDDVTRSEIIKDLKLFQKAWRGHDEKPVKDAQKILDGISALFGEEVASK